MSRRLNIDLIPFPGHAAQGQLPWSARESFSRKSVGSEFLPDPENSSDTNFHKRYRSGWPLPSLVVSPNTVC
jgi:hypothetical protein